MINYTMGFSWSPITASENIREHKFDCQAFANGHGNLGILFFTYFQKVEQVGDWWSDGFVVPRVSPSCEHLPLSHRTNSHY